MARVDTISGDISVGYIQALTETLEERGLTIENFKVNTQEEKIELTLSGKDALLGEDKKKTALSMATSFLEKLSPYSVVNGDELNKLQRYIRDVIESFMNNPIGYLGLTVTGTALLFLGMTLASPLGLVNDVLGIAGVLVGLIVGISFILHD